MTTMLLRAARRPRSSRRVMLAGTTGCLFLLAAGLSRAWADRPGETAASNRLEPDEIAAGWIRLFDGETMFGWKANGNVNWQITDGVIHGDKGDPGLLVT